MAVVALSRGLMNGLQTRADGREKGLRKFVHSAVSCCYHSAPQLQVVTKNRATPGDSRFATRRRRSPYIFQFCVRMLCSRLQYWI